MSDNRNRLRPIQVKFFVTAEELEQIKQRMAGFGTENLSAHLRKLALEGTYEIEERTEIQKRKFKKFSQISSAGAQPILKTAGWKCSTISSAQIPCVLHSVTRKHTKIWLSVLPGTLPISLR